MHDATPTTPSIDRRARWPMLLVAATLLVAAVSACTTGGGTSTSDELPSWIDEIRPSPDADLTPADGVSVRFTLTDTDQEVRLIVDGIDVTADAVDSSGFLRYDAGSAGPVSLGEGEHTAEVQLVTRATAGVDDVVVDSYRWMFRVT